MSGEAGRQALREALEQSGLSISAAARACGVDRGTLSAWLTGRYLPFRDRLERLAAVLNAPDLLTVVEHRHHRIVLTCRQCGGENAVMTHYAVARSRTAEPGRVSIDLQTGHGQYVCMHCSSRTNGRAFFEKLRKRKGQRGVVEMSQSANEALSRKNPEARSQALVRARQGVGKVQRTTRQIARKRLGLLRLDVGGTFGICRSCGRLMFSPTTAQRGASGGSFHGACLWIWRGSQQMRDWQGQCRRAEARGEPSPSMPLPQRPADRMPSAEDLRAAYVTTVRYFWQREGSRRADRDDLGRPRSAAWLANDLAISRDALYKRVERFLELLPSAGVGGRHERMWRDILLTLSIESEASQENAIQVAHAPEQNAIQVAQP